MNKSQILALYDQDQRTDLEHPNTRREVTPNIVRHVNASEVEEGFISYSQLNQANADDMIREQISYFESIGQDFEWKLYDYDQPSDLKERLKAHGFIVEEAEAIMVLDLEDAADILWQPIPSNVQQIIDPQRLVDVQSVEQQVWNEGDSFYLEFLGNALRNYPEQMSVYVAYMNEQPASAAWIYFPKHSQFASLWGGSTVGAFRMQGLYTALLAARAQEAKSRQVKFLTVDASPMSRPILERMGFEMIATSYPCRWKRKSTN
jgi:hypothetical protein